MYGFIVWIYEVCGYVEYLSLYILMINACSLLEIRMKLRIKCTFTAVSGCVAHFITRHVNKTRG